MATDPTLPAPDSQPLFRGVLGGGASRPGRANLRLIRRAIREDWPIPDEKRQALVEHLEAVVGHENERSSIAAAWGILEADRANLRAEDPEADGRQKPADGRPRAG
jgi:hypothetical protein